MADKISKKQYNDGLDINPIVAGITGAVIGAGIAIAGAVVMKDEKNRDKAKKVLENVKEAVGNYVKDLENSGQKKTEVVEEKLAKGIGKAKRLASSTENTLHLKAEEAIKTSNK